MSQLTVKKENDSYCISKTLVAPESCNHQEIDKLMKEPSDIFLPIVYHEEGNKVTLQCVAKGLIPFSEFLHRVIDKQTFIEIVIQMVMMIRVGEQHGFTVNNLDLDYNRVFIEPHTTKVYFIYWPILNTTSRCNLQAFFSEIAYQAVFTRNEDNSYVSQYIRFFRKGELFSLINFEEMIMLLANDGEEREEAASTEKIYQSEPECAGGETTTLNPDFWMMEREAMKAEKTKGKSGALFKKSQTYYNEPTFYNQYEPVQPNIGFDPNETSVLTPELMNFTLSSSAKLGGRMKQEPPYLIRESRGERINIGKAVFVIGKDRDNADYVISNNRTISRKHASIIIRGTHYYVIDHNSTNSTFVDEKKIAGNIEVEIYNGTKLRFSDEKFTFYT